MKVQVEQAKVKLVGLAIDNETKMAGGKGKGEGGNGKAPVTEPDILKEIQWANEAVSQGIAHKDVSAHFKTRTGREMPAPMQVPMQTGGNNNG
jgi:hypothetical protein